MAATADNWLEKNSTAEVYRKTILFRASLMQRLFDQPSYVFFLADGFSWRIRCLQVLSQSPRSRSVLLIDTCWEIRLILHEKRLYATIKTYGIFERGHIESLKEDI